MTEALIVTEDAINAGGRTVAKDDKRVPVAINTSCQVMPDPTPEEDDSLMSDIDRRSVQVPLLVDEDGYIIDASVRQPDRKGLPASAACGKPFEQCRPEPFVWDVAKALFGARQILELGDAERKRCEEHRKQVRSDREDEPCEYCTNPLTPADRKACYRQCVLCRSRFPRE